MAKTKHLEAEIWCPDCRVYAGKVWKTELRDGMYEHYTEPKTMPKKCSLCEGVLVRKK
jgi:hypothetical protein